MEVSSEWFLSNFITWVSHLMYSRKSFEKFFKTENIRFKTRFQAILSGS